MSRRRVRRHERQLRTGTRPFEIGAAPVPSSWRYMMKAFTHVTVIDATGATPLSDMTVVIEDGRIVDLGKSRDVRLPRHALIIEARGRYKVDAWRRSIS